MTLLYKLTDQNYKTRAGFPNETLWGEGVEHSVNGDAGKPLCSDGWLHAYTDPLLAVLLNPIHAAIAKPVLWEAEGEVGKSDGCKVGCRTLRTVRIIPLPNVTIEQRVRFAILCAKRVCTDEKWNAWADAWLNGADRSREAAWAAWAARTAAARTAAAWAAAAAERTAQAAAARTALALAAAAAARTAALAAERVAENTDLIAIAKEVV